MSPVAAGALLIDGLWGEPPAALHPTVWMGRWIAAGRRRVTAGSDGRRFLAGIGITAGGVALTVAIARLVERLARGDRRQAGILLEALALKPAIALRGLVGAGRAVEQALRSGDLPRARRLLSRHLVSRDTAELDPDEVAGAAISSLAENLSDGVIGPLLAWRGGGLPGAYAYRFVNTADSMLGYRTPELEWLGKFAARCDDVANLAPARLTALLIALAAPVGRGAPLQSLRVAWRDARRPPSPNAGWPMAAMAGALGVRLSKRGVYRLHERGRPPDCADLARARRIIVTAAVLATAVVTAS